MAKKKGTAPNDDTATKRLEQPLQAVLLTEDWSGSSFAANVDERYQFHPLVLDRPKVLSPLLNTPMLDYAIHYLEGQSVEEVYVVCVTEHVEQYLLKYVASADHHTQTTSLKLTVIRDSTVTNAGDALRELDKRNVIQSDPFVLMHADTIANCSLGPTIQTHKERHAADSSAILTLVLQAVQPTSPLRPATEDLVIGLDASHDNRILLYEDNRDSGTISIPCSFLASHCAALELRTDLMDTGLALCSPDVLARFSDEFDYRHIRREFVANSVAEEEEGLQNKLFAHVLASEEYAARIQTPRTYHAVARDLLRRYVYPVVPDNAKDNINQHQYSMQRHYQYYERTSRVGRSSTVTGPGMMGSHCVVGEHCRIRRSVLGDHSHIGDHCSVSDSHLWEGVVVEQGATIQQSVLGAGAIVKAGAVVARGCIIGAGCVVGTGIKLPEYTRLTCAAEEKDDDFDDDWEESSHDEDGSAEEKSPPKNLDHIQIISNAAAVGEDGKGRIWTPPMDDDDDDSNEENVIPAEESLKSLCIGFDPTQLFSERDKHQKNDDDSFSIDDGLANVALDDEYADRADVTFETSEAASLVIGRQEGVDVVKELKTICLEFESNTSPIENLAIELNSYKFSQNASYSNCTMAATLAIMEKMKITKETSDGKLVAEFKSILDQWAPLLQKMSIGLDEEKSIVLALERCAVGEGDIDDEAANRELSEALSTGKSFRLLLQMLHDEEIVSEDAVLAWAADRKEEDGEKDSPRGRLFRLQPVQDFLEWLDEESDDDDDEEEEEQSGSEEESDNE